jgi:MFS family permease
MLFCLEKNYTFTEIGLLIAIREILIFILEIPTGAIADTFGRKKSMILSFMSYIASFLCYYYSTTFIDIIVATSLFSLGEAFRTGTHKAIIFSWLRHNKREEEKTHIYGFTRSWSKFGSAISIPIAAIIVYFSQNYTFIFLISTIPCLFNILNFISYPSYLDSENNILSESKKNKFLMALKTFSNSVKKSIINKDLRRILIESMNFEGLYKTTKDYLQPLLQSFAMTIILIPNLDDTRKTALVFGLVYFFLNLLSAFASRFAGKFESIARNQKNASKILWHLYLWTFVLFAISIYFSVIFLQIMAFVILSIIQNLWRPILIARCAEVASPNETATVLSIESQAKSLFTVLAAPLVGWGIDFCANISLKLQFVPIVFLGILVPFIILLKYYRESKMLS